MYRIPNIYFNGDTWNISVSYVICPPLPAHLFTIKPSNKHKKKRPKIDVSFVFAPLVYKWLVFSVGCGAGGTCSLRSKCSYINYLDIRH